MKVSLNWLKEFVSIEMPVEALAEALTMAGLEVESISERYAYLDSVLVGRIVGIHKHPNADKQRIARLERQLAQFGPWAQFGMAVGNDPKMGKRIMDKYQRGESLFEDEQAALDVAAEQVGEKAVTLDDVANLLDQREASKNLFGELNSIAEEELDGFKKIKNPILFHHFPIKVIRSNKKISTVMANFLIHRIKNGERTFVS